MTQRAEVKHGRKWRKATKEKKKICNTWIGLAVEGEGGVAVTVPC